MVDKFAFRYPQKLFGSRLEIRVGEADNVYYVSSLCRNPVNAQQAAVLEDTVLTPSERFFEDWMVVYTFQNGIQRF